MKKNFRITRLAIEVGAFLIVILIFFILNRFINRNRSCSFVVLEDSNAYAFNVDSVELEKDDFVIKGWFFEVECIRNVKQNVNKSSELGVLVYDLHSEQEFNLDGSLKPLKGMECFVERCKREDINNYFKCEYDYSDCGFIARLDKDDIDLENGQYQIFFKTDWENNAGGLQAFAYIDKGKLTHVNPIGFCKLNVHGTDMERIVEEGFCLVNYPEYHIYVYQYNKKLYWIAEDGFCFEEDGGTYLEYQLETTQFDKLPFNRIANGWFWSNIGFEFETNEITEKMNCGQYRVSVTDLPQEYSIYWIMIGYYVDDRWIWRKSLRPLI